MHLYICTYILHIPIVRPYIYILDTASYTYISTCIYIHITSYTYYAHIYIYIYNMHITHIRSNTHANIRIYKHIHIYPTRICTRTPIYAKYPLHITHNTLRKISISPPLGKHTHTSFYLQHNFSGKVITPQDGKKW